MSAPTPGLEARVSVALARYRRPLLVVAPLAVAFALPLAVLVLVRVLLWAAGLEFGAEARWSCVAFGLLVDFFAVPLTALECWGAAMKAGGAR